MKQRWEEFQEAVEQILILKKFKYLQIKNYRCFKCGQVQNSQATGWPDFYVYYPVRLAIECKTGAGNVKKAQAIVLENMRQGGTDVLVLHDNVDELLEYLKGKRI